MMQNARTVIPLSKQVQYFDATMSKMVAEVGSAAVSTSIFLISAGNNDLFAGQARFADLISNYSANIMVRNGTHRSRAIMIFPPRSRAGTSYQPVMHAPLY